MGTHYAESFERQVGAERVMLMPPFNVVMAARIEGSVEANTVRQAVERLRVRHALLGSRVQFYPDGSAQYRIDNVPELAVREVRADEVTGSDSALWLDEVMAECRTAFSLSTGPLVRFVLIRGVAESYLLITAHHAICDGKSLAFLLRDVLQAMASPEHVVESLPPPPQLDSTTVPHPPRTPWLVRQLLKVMTRAWEKKNIHFSEADRARLHEAFWAKHTGARATAWELKQEQTTKLIAACRSEGVTVNSALWTAFLLAQRDVQGDTPCYRHQAGIAVSTREQLKVPVGEAFGFYASSLGLRLVASSRLPFWEAARSVQCSIREAMDKAQLFRMLAATSLPPTLLDSLYFAKYGLIAERKSSRMLKRMRWDRISYGYSITNVGRAEIPTQYGPYTLKAIHGPFFYSDVNEKVVGVTTVGDTLTFALTANESTIGKGVNAQLQDASLAHLERALTTTG